MYYRTVRIIIIVSNHFDNTVKDIEEAHYSIITVVKKDTLVLLLL